MATDRTRKTFSLEGKEIKGKNNLVLEIVRLYVSQNPNLTLSKLYKTFNSESLLRDGNVVETYADALTILDENKNGGGNYFIGKDEQLVVGGEKVVVWKYWPDRYFVPFIDMVKSKLGYKIEEVKTRSSKSDEVSSKDGKNSNGLKKQFNLKLETGSYHTIQAIRLKEDELEAFSNLDDYADATELIINDTNLRLRFIVDEDGDIDMDDFYNAYDNYLCEETSDTPEEYSYFDYDSGIKLEVIDKNGLSIFSVDNIYGDDDPEEKLVIKKDPKFATCDYYDGVYLVQERTYKGGVKLEGSFDADSFETDKLETRGWKYQYVDGIADYSDRWLYNGEWIDLDIFEEAELQYYTTYVFRVEKGVVKELKIEPISEKKSASRTKPVSEPKYGFIDKTGKVVIPFEYDSVRNFREDLASVEKDEKSGFVDRTGKVVVPIEYYRVDNFSEGLAGVEKDGKSGFVDKTGKVVVPIEYDYVEDFHEGLAAVEKDEKYGFINKTGKIVVPIEYDSVRNFSEGLAEVKKDEKYGFIDKTGKVVVPIEYDSFRNFKEGLVIVKKGGEYGFVDKTGKVVVPIEYAVAGNFCEGLASVEKDRKCGFVDKTGNVVIPIVYDKVYDFCEGVAVVVKDGEFCVIDKTGNVVVPMEYDGIENFCEGLSAVEKDGKYGFIDKTGNVVVPIEYDSVENFCEGLAAVEKDGEYGFVDKTGKVVVPTEYDSVEDFCEGLAAVEKDGEYGFVDKSGNVVVSIEYERVENFREGLAMVRKNRKYGFIDKNGKVVIPLEYDSAYDFSEGLACVKK